jgi:hypothetical protein
MGKEDGKSIYIIKKQFGESYKIVSVNGSPLKIKGTNKALRVLKILEEKYGRI